MDGQPLRAGVLRDFYALTGLEPVWGPDADGAARAALAIEALRGARDHGLTPAHYRVNALRRRSEPGTLGATVERELLLTDALLRYAVDLRSGRLRPTAIQPDWGIPSPPREDPSASWRRRLNLARSARGSRRSRRLGLRLGSVGYYPASGFVHGDVGRVRFW